jgi:hypothetical protein
MPTFQLKFASSKPRDNFSFLTGAVGERGANQPHDLALVQTMLKALRAGRTGQPFYAGRIDGRTGPKTVAAIGAFKSEVTGGQKLPDPGTFDKNSNQFRQLVQRYNKHVRIASGTAIPLMGAPVQESDLRNRIERLEWAEPMFRKDLAEFAVEVLHATGFEIGFQPPQSGQTAYCQTDAEVVFAPFVWLTPDGYEQRVNNGDLGSSPATRTLVAPFQNFARQFELFFSVGAGNQAMTLSQSRIRMSERARAHPWLDSIWVKHPTGRGELLLVEPKTGSLRVQAGDKPIVMPQGLGPSQTRFEPPCSLPALVPHQGTPQAVQVAYPNPDTFVHLCTNGQPLKISSTGPLTLTLAQAGSLHLLDPNNIDPQANFCTGPDTPEIALKVSKALAGPTFRRLANFILASEKKFNFETGASPSEMTSAITQLLNRVANATPGSDINVDGMIDEVRSMLGGSEPELRAAIAAIRDRGISADRIIVTPPAPNFLDIAFKNIPGDGPTVPGRQLADRNSFPIARNPGLHIHPLTSIGNAMIELVALPPQDQADPVYQGLEFVGQVISDVVLARFTPIGVVFAIAESFATTDNNNDFYVSLGVSLLGLGAGGIARRTSAIESKIAPALADPRLKLNPATAQKLTTYMGQTLETAVDQGVQGVAGAAIKIAGSELSEK